MFAPRLHTGPELSVFPLVTVDEVQKLLASMPRKTSPLDVLPASLLKDCADVFASAITRLANLSLETGKFPKRLKSAQVLPLSCRRRRGSTEIAATGRRYVCHSNTIFIVLWCQRRRQPRAKGTWPPNCRLFLPTVKQTGQESGDELCTIFKFRLFLQSKNINSV